jgi:hypothetical protein
MSDNSAAQVQGRKHRSIARQLIRHHQVWLPLTAADLLAESGVLAGMSDCDVHDCHRMGYSEIVSGSVYGVSNEHGWDLKNPLSLQRPQNSALYQVPPCSLHLVPAQYLPASPISPTVLGVRRQQIATASLLDKSDCRSDLGEDDVTPTTCMPRPCRRTKRQPAHPAE